MIWFLEKSDMLPVPLLKSRIEEVIHKSICKVYNSAKIRKRLEEFQVTWLLDPPFSPGISPCDLRLFCWSKNEVHDHTFHIRVFIWAFWHNLDPTMLI
jgi:hypothetical protein